MSKREISTKDTDLQNRKKKRLKKLIYWLAIDLSVAFIIFALLLYKPGQYNPNESFDKTESTEISPFLTKLSSEIYNKGQLGKPFEIVITEEAINDILNRGDWPMESQGILLYAPAAVINPDSLVLMGTADFQGIEFIITIELQANINEQDMMNIVVPLIKIGAVNITPLAKITAKKMYAEKIASLGDFNPYDWQTKLAASLFNEEPFEPVFQIERQNIRIKKITMEKGKMTVSVVPVKSQEKQVR